MHTRPLIRRAVLALAVALAAALGAVLMPLLVAPEASGATVAAGPAAEPEESGSRTGKGGSAGEDLQTIGIGPANKDGVDRRGVFVYAGRPGTVVRDQVALVNYTTKPQRVRVYAADAFTTESGGFDVRAAGVEAVDVASWIDLEPRTVTIPARKSARAVKPGTRLIPFTLTVPDDASPGDHAGGFVVSLRAADAPQGTNAVVVDRRVGTRVYVQVVGATDPRLEVTDLRAEYAGTLNPVGKGTTRVSYTVRNTGNVILSARQSTRVETWFSDASPATAQPDLLQLLPGAAVDVTVDVPGTWPTFRPEAVVTLVPYTGVGEAAVDLDPVSASTRFWAVPWTLIALVVALVLLLLGHRWWQRRRAARRAAHDALTPPAPPAPELVDA